jgi:hypothetical protein
MQGEIRVTVIATGFDRALGQSSTMATMPHAVSASHPGRTVIPINTGRAAPARPAPVRPPVPDPGRRFAPPAAPPSPSGRAAEQIEDLDIPTFIRRQMD